MAASDYIIKIRSKIGHDLLLCPSVAAVILDDQKRLLLQERSSGEGWSLPAGAIEPGENPEAAIVREVEEETALIVEPVRILGVFGGKDFRYVYANGDQVEYTVVLFLCEVRGHSQQAVDAETKSLRYFSEHELPALVLPYPKHLLFAKDENG